MPHGVTNQMNTICTVTSVPISEMSQCVPLAVVTSCFVMGRVSFGG